MPIDFPNSPAPNDTFTVGDRTWRWTGSVWESVANPGVAGSANQILYKNASNAPTGSNSLTFDGTTVGITGKANITASGTTVVPLTLKGASSQSANLQEWRNSAEAVIGQVSANGFLSFGDGVESLGSANNTRPLNISGTSATLRVWRTGGGDPAYELISGTDYAGGPGSALNTWWDFYTNSDRFLIRRRTGGAPLLGLTIDPAGRVGTGIGSADSVGQLASFASTASTVGLVVRAATDQTANLQVWQNSAGTVLGGISPNGQVFTGVANPTITGVGGATTAASGTGTTATITTTSAHGLAIGDRITVSGITPTGYNGTYIVTAVPTTTQISYANTTTGSQTVAGTVASDAQQTIFARSAGTTALIVRGASGQAAALTSWRDSAGSSLANVNSGGDMTARTFIPTGSNAPTNGMFLGAANTLSFAASSANRVNISSAGLTILRTDATSEGAQLNLARSSDNANGWAIDVVGTGTDTTLRFLQNTSSGEFDRASFNTTGQLVANPAVPTAANSAKAVGYVGIPQNAPTISGAYTYTFGLADAGEHFYATGTPSSVTLTIPASGVTNFEIGTTIVIINDLGAATNISIAINTDTLVLAGTGATGTRTLARYGMATLVKVTATKWYISGNGLT